VPKFTRADYDSQLTPPSPCSWLSANVKVTKRWTYIIIIIIIIIIITLDYTADKAIGPGELLRCDKQTPEYCLCHPAGKPYPSGCPGPHPLRAERQ
jgi:hypothetical protein